MKFHLNASHLRGGVLKILIRDKNPFEYTLPEEKGARFFNLQYIIDFYVSRLRRGAENFNSQFDLYASRLRGGMHICSIHNKISFKYFIIIIASTNIYCYPSLLSKITID